MATGLKTISRRGFTLVELLVVVTILVLLIAILVPALNYARRYAERSATQATMHALTQGLEQYYSECGNTYPSSTPFNYGGNIANPRGSLMLAEALTGYLPYNLDGAGPSLSYTANSVTITDPPYGFRIRTGGHGKIYGPYAPTDDPKLLKVNTAANDRVFIDRWGNEILYYRAVPPLLKSGQVGVADQIRTVSNVFAHWKNYPTPPGSTFTGIFVVEDNATVIDASGNKIPDPSSIVVPPAFWSAMGGSGNVVNAGDVIVGADSYLLVSAGPDGVYAPPQGGYFTADDIIQVRK